MILINDWPIETSYHLRHQALLLASFTQATNQLTLALRIDEKPADLDARRTSMPTIVESSPIDDHASLTGRYSIHS
jgi:hypothetical protein